MSGFDYCITSWMRDHHAVVSSGVLTGAGVSETQRRRLVEHGVLERVVDGAYRFCGVPDEEVSRCVPLCSSRPRLVVAGPTAGRIWGIRRSPRDQLVHVLAPPASNPCREPWVRAYRTALIDPGDIVHCRDGLRLTSPPRTLVDLARHLSSEALMSAVESVLHEQMCTLATMQRVARRLATPGRPWARRFLAVVDGRIDGAARESGWECKVVDALSDSGVRNLATQHRIEVGPGRAVRFDIAVPTLRWALEIDVHPEHRTLEGQVSDDRRDRCSRRFGWLTEHVGEAELLRDFAAVIDELVESIGMRRAEVERLRAAGCWPQETVRG